MFHLFLHALVPLILSVLLAKHWFKQPWYKVFIIMMLTMLIDLDHLVATPIYDPLRCSMNFHPLHKLWLVPFYAALMLFKPLRAVGAGLSIHMILDSIDCQVNQGVWFHSAT
ncbi:MAG: hypothetical protein HWE13_06215 [Gammaproteobacteria bacterium]|nr:hypothetical protein [Gammaproteobacteria bacterium]